MNSSSNNRDNFWSPPVITMVLFCMIAGASVAVAADSGPPTTRETPAPDYSAFKQSYRMPFGNVKPVNFDHLQSMSVRVSLNGGPPLRFQIDTGSTGVIVGAAEVPNVDRNAPAGSITYSSSGIELDGVWTPVTITFLDSTDANGNVATATVPVLAVSLRKIHPGAVNGSAARPDLKNPKVFMFGIGTGRGPEVHQERNPWVNLKEMQAGTMRRGYTISRAGVTLGLTTESVGEGYLYEKLKPHVAAPTTVPTTVQTIAPSQPVVKDWDSSRGWVTVDGVRKPTSNMLLDTGLTNMMLDYPDVTAQTDLPIGTDVTVNLLSGRLHYNFKVGDATNPAAPRKVTWVTRPKPFVNTGLRALAMYDYLYDADGGYVGLRPTRK